MAGLLLPPLPMVPDAPWKEAPQPLRLVKFVVLLVAAKTALPKVTVWFWKFGKPPRPKGPLSAWSTKMLPVWPPRTLTFRVLNPAGASVRTSRVPPPLKSTAPAAVLRPSAPLVATRAIPSRRRGWAKLLLLFCSHITELTTPAPRMNLSAAVSTPVTWPEIFQLPLPCRIGLLPVPRYKGPEMVVVPWLANTRDSVPAAPIVRPPARVL